MERNPSNIAACLFYCTPESCMETGVCRRDRITSLFAMTASSALTNYILRAEMWGPA